MGSNADSKLGRYNGLSSNWGKNIDLSIMIWLKAKMPMSFVFYQIDTIMFSSWKEFIVPVHSWPKHSTQKQLLVLFSWLASHHRRWYELKHDVLLLTNCYSLQIRLAVRVCYMICFSIKAKYIQERFRISAKNRAFPVYKSRILSCSSIERDIGDTLALSSLLLIFRTPRCVKNQLLILDVMHGQIPCMARQ